jgi:outer membrane protein
MEQLRCQSWRLVQLAKVRGNWTLLSIWNEVRPRKREYRRGQFPNSEAAIDPVPCGTYNRTRQRIHPRSPADLWPHRTHVVWAEWTKVYVACEVSHRWNENVLKDSARSTPQQMTLKLALVSALAAGMAAAGAAQTAAPQPAAKPAAPPAPQAVPAKIAVIEYEQVAAATNEGQKAVADVQKKYEPQIANLQKQKEDIDSLTKQLQSAPATMSDDEKASRARTLDTKQKQLQRDGEDTQNAYQTEAQDAIDKVAKKLGPVVMKYVQENGYTMLLDNTGQPQQGGLNVLWAPGTDISEAVVDAYNKQSGVAAPVPSAPTSTARPRPSTPRTTPATPAK